jgi:hypothetical protein
MTRPDHTAVPPADVIAAAWPEATDIDLLRDAAYAYWLFVKKHEGPHQAGLVANAQRLDQLIDRMARAQGAAPTAAQAAGRSVAQCTNSDSWNCKYCRKTETCEALKDPRNFGAPSASHAPNATLAASRDAESATSGATSAAKLAVPAGWKLVPIDPTDAMVLAPGAIGTGGNVARIHREIWRRMLEAAPAAPLKPE